MTVPGAGTAVTFAGGGGTCVVNAAESTAASLTFSTSAGFTLSIAPQSTLSVSGSVSDSYALTVTGGGMLVLQAVNPGLTGPVTVSGGTLYCAYTGNSGNCTLGNASSITINNGGAITVDGYLTNTSGAYNAFVGGGGAPGPSTSTRGACSHKRQVSTASTAT